MTKKAKITLITVIIVALALLVLILSTGYIVAEDEYGIVRQFGKVVTIRDEAGFYIKIPFIEEVSALPKNLLLYDVTPSDVLTADKKALVVDSYAVWRIVDPLLFLQSVGSVTEMESRIDAATFSVVKNTMGTMIQTDIIQSGASEANRNNTNIIITAKVNEQLTSEYGVEVKSIEIKKLDLPEANESAVYDRMISEREQMAAKYVAEGELEASVIRNDTDKQASIIISQAEAEAEKIKGEGEAEYMRIIAEAYATADQRDFYEFYRSLEALRSVFTDGSDRTRKLVLPEDSYLASLFLSNQ